MNLVIIGSALNLDDLVDEIGDGANSLDCLGSGQVGFSLGGVQRSRETMRIIFAQLSAM